MFNLDHSMRADQSDPQAKLNLAREILFFIASAEHEAKNAPKTVEHEPVPNGPANP
jgi:hypothetical protein